jgi:hypothetical protein
MLCDGFCFSHAESLEKEKILAMLLGGYKVVKVLKGVQKSFDF